MTAAVLMAPTPPNPVKFLSASQLTQAVAGTLLAAAILSTASGVFWLVSILPSKLSSIEHSLDVLSDRTELLERLQRDQERRIVIIEAQLK